MKFERSAGILLHPTSLPGPYGIGDLGHAAYQWIDLLSDTGCTLWQVLPLGPTGYGDSPYQCFSAFAGNPYLISPDLLVEENLLTPEDLTNIPEFSQKQVDYGPVINWKLKILDRAFENFEKTNSTNLLIEFAQFQEQNLYWLPDFSMFMALKEANQGNPWHTWAPALRSRSAIALKSAEKIYARDIRKQTFRQFLFFKQWTAVKKYANEKGIKIIGDIPIFVAHDSAEVWSHPELFFINRKGQPTVVAGVPPDYFSPTGQLWGNPLYQWETHAQTGYAWWIERFKAVLNLVDIIRLDHFRGFAGYWEVPAKHKTAEKGHWKPGPGIPFFKFIQDTFGDLPILAEDLGEITPDVDEMRDHFNLPGMRILVFAFGDDATNDFLPHNFIPNCVVYTGTHDNDTVLGWYQRVSEKERDYARRYLGRNGTDIPWDLIRLAWASVAVIAIAPMQDLLGLDNSARMNYPSRPSGNWGWRMNADDFDQNIQKRLSEFNILYRRGKPTEIEKKNIVEETM